MYELIINIFRKGLKFFGGRGVGVNPPRHTKIFIIFSMPFPVMCSFQYTKSDIRSLVTKYANWWNFISVHVSTVFYFFLCVKPSFSSSLPNDPCPAACIIFYTFMVLILYSFFAFSTAAVVKCNEYQLN